MNRIEKNCIIQADNICDYIPIVSTITNIMNIFLKLVIPFMANILAIRPKFHYFAHVNEKDLGRCLLLLVPIVGNIIVGIMDCCKVKPAEPLEGEALEFTEDFLNKVLGIPDLTNIIMEYDGALLSREEKEEAMARVLADPLALEHERPLVKKDRDIVKAAVELNGLALRFADITLRDDPEIVSIAVAQNGAALKYASEDLRADPEIVKMALRATANYHTFYHAARPLWYVSTEMEGSLTLGGHELHFQVTPGNLEDDSNTYLDEPDRFFPPIQYCTTEALEGDEREWQQPKGLKYYKTPIAPPG